LPGGEEDVMTNPVRSTHVMIVAARFPTTPR
jgi:hypothetical protein